MCKLLLDRDRNCALLLFVPMVREGSKIYTVRGSLVMTHILNNGGTQDSVLSVSASVLNDRGELLLKGNVQ